MRLQRIFVAVGILASVSHSASAQTVDAFGNCVSPAGVATADAGIFMLQSPVVSTIPIPVTAQLLSSRIVQLGVVPATQLNSLSTFGATPVSIGSPFVSNSVGFAPAARTFSLAPTVGVPTALSFPSTSSRLTLSVPQVLTSAPLADSSPGVSAFLANRLATENSLSCAAEVQSTPTMFCSAKSLQSIEDRINALDGILAKLEKSSRGPGSGGSEDELDELLGDSPDDQLAPSPVKDEIDELLQNTTE